MSNLFWKTTFLSRYIFYLLSYYHNLSTSHIIHHFFYFINFSTLNSVDLLYAILFHKMFRHFFPLNFSIIYINKTVFLTSFIKKKLCQTNLKLKFCKNVFIFWYYSIITNSIFTIFVIVFYIRLHFNGSIMCIYVFINYII